MPFEVYWLQLIIVAARVAAFIFMFPMLRGNSVPMLAKTSIVLALSSYIASGVEIIEVSSAPELVGIIIIEVIIGFTLAFLVEIMFSVVRVAGSLIDMDIGLANPFFDGGLNSQVTPIAKIMHYVFLLVFISIGGFEKVISGFAYTFELSFRDGVFGSEFFLNFILDTFNYMFFGALQIAIPFMMSTFLIYIALLLMSKTVDKINILMNIFGIKIMVGMTMLLLCIPVIMVLFEQLNESLIQNYHEIIGMLFSK